MPALKLRLRDGVEAHGTLLHVPPSCLVPDVNGNFNSMVKIQMPRRRSPSRTRSRRSPRRSPRRSLRRSPRRRSPRRRTGRTYRSTVKIMPQGSDQLIPGTVTDHIQDLMITIGFDALPDGLNENDRVRIDGVEGLWRVSHISPPPGPTIVFSKIQADVDSMVDMLSGLLTVGNVTQPPPPAPPPPPQAVVGTAPVFFYSPTADASSVQISSSPTRDDEDVESELQIAASGSPPGSTRISTRILPSSNGDIVGRNAPSSVQDAPRPERRTRRRRDVHDIRRDDRRERSPARSPEQSPARSPEQSDGE